MEDSVGGISYLKTVPGICKVLQVIFSLCAFISAVASELYWSSATHAFFCVASLLALIYALVIVVLSILNIITSLQMGPKIDVTLCILFSILIFSSAALYTNMTSMSSAIMAACIFQYLNGFIFLGNTLYKVLE